MNYRTNPFTCTWMIDNIDENKILRNFLYEQQYSRAALKEIKFHGGTILVNNTVANVRTKLHEGDCVTVIFPQETVSPRLGSEASHLDIVFEDDFLIVVNKPAGMSTIPSHDHPTGSLANALIAHYEQQNEQATIHTVTRLDRDTSGLVLIAKYRHIHHLLALGQKRKQITRRYQALVQGHLDQDGKIDLPIGRKAGSIIEREVHPDGKPAQTNIKRVSAYQQFSHIELQLETGRTHQIRVHLSYIGHPLLGDQLYGGDITQIRRQALHCSALSFDHPLTKEPIHLSAQLPNDFSQLLTPENS